MKPIDKRQADKELKQAGYNPLRQESSHAIYRNEQGLTISLPLGHGRDISPGVWRSVSKQAGITGHNK